MPEDHDRLEIGPPVGKARGKAGLAELAHPVDQQPGLAPSTQACEAPLQLAPTAHERCPASDWALLPSRIQELLMPVLAMRRASRKILAANQNTATLGPEPETR